MNARRFQVDRVEPGDQVRREGCMRVAGRILRLDEETHGCWLWVCCRWQFQGIDPKRTQRAEARSWLKADQGCGELLTGAKRNTHIMQVSVNTRRPLGRIKYHHMDDVPVETDASKQP